VNNEVFWETSEDDLVAKDEPKIEPFSSEKSEQSVIEPEHTFTAGKVVLILIIASWLLWSSVIGPLIDDTQINDYASEAMSWPSTAVHSDSILELWSEDISCGDDFCSERFFSAELVLNCALVENEVYTCNPEIENGTLFGVELACEPSDSSFNLGGGIHYKKLGPMPDPCVATDFIFEWKMEIGWDDESPDFPVQYSDPRYDEPWEVYDTECMWQSEPDDEPYWNCYYADGEYDTWWYHCEFSTNTSLWFCTDAFGMEASSEDNHNATERPNGSDDEFLASPEDAYSYEDALEVRYDPSDPTRIYIGDPGAVSINPSVYLGIAIVGIAMLVGLVRFIPFVTGRSRIEKD